MCFNGTQKVFIFAFDGLLKTDILRENGPLFKVCPEQKRDRKRKCSGFMGLIRWRSTQTRLIIVLLPHFGITRYDTLTLMADF